MRLVVAALLVDSATQPTSFIAARRTSPAQMAGRYELPGGKQEPEESPIQALHREIREELGVSIRVQRQIRSTTPTGCWPLTPTLHMRTWLATITDGTPLPLEEHDEVRWVGLGEWADLPWLTGDIPAIQQWLQHHTSPPPPT